MLGWVLFTLRKEHIKIRVDVLGTGLQNCGDVGGTYGQ